MTLTKDDLQAIGGILDQRLKPIEQDIKTLKIDMGVVKAAVSHIETAVNAVAEGQKDLRSKVVKQLKSHERRITGLEVDAHSHKN